MTIRVTIDTSQGDSELLSLAASLNHPRPFLKSWAASVAKDAQKIARGKGGRRFWSDFARRIRVTTVTDEYAIVENDHYAANIKQYGGVIQPVNARALTIPVSEEAKGKRASEFESGGRDLFVVPRDRAETIGLLAYADAQGDLHVLYVLRTRSVQQPDPWWPADADVMALGIREARWWANRQLNK